MTTKSQRVLACIACQQRKIKCDRKFPCANCLKACSQCIPASLVPRQRRRRFPERELLDRLRRYESLLLQHNVDFVPLHGSNEGSAIQKHDQTQATSANSEDDAKEVLDDGTAIKIEPIYQAK